MCTWSYCQKGTSFPRLFMNAPLFSLGTALSVSIIILAQSDAVVVACCPPMSDTASDLVIDKDSGRPGLTCLDPTRIHSHECDTPVFNRLLSRLEDHNLLVRFTPHTQPMKLGECARTNIPTAALLIEYTAQPGLVACARLPNPLDMFITTLLFCACSSRGTNFWTVSAGPSTFVESVSMNAGRVVVARWSLPPRGQVGIFGV